MGLLRTLVRSWLHDLIDALCRSVFVLGMATLPHALPPVIEDGWNDLMQRRHSVSHADFWEVVREALEGYEGPPLDMRRPEIKVQP